jgi:hypothetical protein
MGPPWPGRQVFLPRFFYLGKCDILRRQMQKNVVTVGQPSLLFQQKKEHNWRVKEKVWLRETVCQRLLVFS